MVGHSFLFFFTPLLFFAPTTRRATAYLALHVRLSATEVLATGCMHIVSRPALQSWHSVWRGLALANVWWKTVGANTLTHEQHICAHAQPTSTYIYTNSRAHTLTHTYTMRACRRSVQQRD